MAGTNGIVTPKTFDLVKMETVSQTYYERTTELILQDDVTGLQMKCRPLTTEEEFVLMGMCAIAANGGTNMLLYYFWLVRLCWFEARPKGEDWMPVAREAGYFNGAAADLVPILQVNAFGQKRIRDFGNTLNGAARLSEAERNEVLFIGGSDATDDVAKVEPTEGAAKLVDPKAVLTVAQ